MAIKLSREESTLVSKNITIYSKLNLSELLHLYDLACELQRASEAFMVYNDKLAPESSFKIKTGSVPSIEALCLIIVSSIDRAVTIKSIPELRFAGIEI